MSRLLMIFLCTFLTFRIALSHFKQAFGIFLFGFLPNVVNVLHPIQKIANDLDYWLKGNNDTGI